MLDRGAKYIQRPACLFRAKRNTTAVYIANQRSHDSTTISFTEENLNKTYAFSAVGEVLAYWQGGGSCPYQNGRCLLVKKFNVVSVFFLEHFFKHHGN